MIPHTLYGQLVEHGEIPERWVDGWVADLCAPVEDSDLMVVPAIRPEMVEGPLANRPAGFLQRVALALGVDVDRVLDNSTTSGVPL